MSTERSRKKELDELKHKKNNSSGKFIKSKTWYTNSGHILEM